MKWSSILSFWIFSHFIFANVCEKITSFAVTASVGREYGQKKELWEKEQVTERKRITAQAKETGSQQDAAKAVNLYNNELEKRREGELKKICDRLLLDFAERRELNEDKELEGIKPAVVKESRVDSLKGSTWVIGRNNMYAYFAAHPEAFNFESFKSACKNKLGEEYTKEYVLKMLAEGPHTVDISRVSRTHDMDPVLIFDPDPTPENPKGQKLTGFLFLEHVAKDENHPAHAFIPLVCSSKAGRGGTLLTTAERLARRRRENNIRLHAVSSAIDVYSNLGYEKEGKVPTSVRTVVGALNRVTGWRFISVGDSGGLETPMCRDVINQTQEDVSQFLELKENLTGSKIDGPTTEENIGVFYYRRSLIKRPSSEWGGCFPDC